MRTITDQDGFTASVSTVDEHTRITVAHEDHGHMSVDLTREQVELLVKQLRAA